MGTVKENKVKLTLTGDAKSLEGVLKSAEVSIKRFGGVAERTGGKIKTFGGMTKGLFSGFGARLGGLPLGGKAAIAAGMIYGTKKVLDFEKGLQDLAIQADMPADEALGPLRDKILAISEKTRLKKEGVVEIMSAIVERIGADDGFFKEIADDAAKISTATGAEPAAIGAIAANLHQKFGLNKQRTSQFINDLVAQGKEGAFEMTNLAEFGEELFTAADAFNINTIEGLKKIGAMIQVTKRAAASPAEASTAFSRFIDELLSKGKREDIYRLTGGKVDIVDIAASQKAGDYVFKNPMDIIQELIAATGGDPFILSQLFSIRAKRTARGFAGIYQEQKARTGAGGFDEVQEKFLKNFGDVITKDFEERLKFPGEKVRDMGLMFDRAVEKTIHPILKGILGENKPDVLPAVNDAKLLSLGISPAVKQQGGIAPTGSFQPLRDALRQIINITISDKQVGVTTDSGNAPAVNLERGDFRGAVP